MNIVILADSLSTQLGGIEKCLYEICLHLYLRGHHITLVYETPGDQLEQYQTICQNLIQIKNFKLKAGFIKGLTGLLKYPIDRVYSHYYDNFFFGSLLSLLKGVPFYVHLHLPAPIEVGRLKQAKQAFTLSKISKYIAVSEAIQVEWMDKLNVPRDRISVAYNGTNVDRFSPSRERALLRHQLGLRDSNKVICYVGRLESYKGIDHLLYAFAALRNVDPDVRLVIAGKSIISGESYERYLRNLATQLQIQDAVKFLDHVAQPEKIYQLSDILVVPSLWLEAFGLVVTEAMACEVPVIASRTGGLPEILSGEFSEYLVDPGDRQQLLVALKKLLNWRTENPQLGQRCRNHVLNYFALDRNIDRVESLLCWDDNPLPRSQQRKFHQAIDIVK